MSSIRIVTFLLAGTALASCSRAATVTEEPGPVVSVVVTPQTAQVQAGGSVQFTSEVTGSADTAVTWSVPEAGGGSVDLTGRYLAPASAGLFHVRATCRADPKVSASAAVTVTPPVGVVVSVAPTTAAVDACRTVTFAATVTGTTNQAVTWSVQEGASGGSIDAGGVYSASDSGGTYHVVATSAADPSRPGSAAVTVSERVLSMHVTPSTSTIASGRSTQFTATVTTTCGTFTTTAQMTPTGQLLTR